MILRRPDIQELTSRCKQGAAILISAPFYSREGLNWVRPNSGGHIEFWTRFNPRDWASGVSDPPALLRYLESVGEEHVSLRVHRALHAKIYQVDATWSWIGSPNLSRSGFTSNIELVAELDAEETELLGNMVNDLRSSLKELPVPTLRAYIEDYRGRDWPVERFRYMEERRFSSSGQNGRQISLTRVGTPTHGAYTAAQ